MRDRYVYIAYAFTDLGRGDIFSNSCQFYLYQHTSSCMYNDLFTPIPVADFLLQIPLRPRFILLISLLLPSPPISLRIHSSGNFGESRNVASGY